MFTVCSKGWMLAGLLELSTWSLHAGLLLVNPTNVASTGASSPAITFIWDPSPDPRAAGYFLCWGLSDGACTNRINVFNTNSAGISGFETNVTYYFSVIAYDAFGEESPPSNQAQYMVSSSLSVDAPSLTFATPSMLEGVVIIPFGFQGVAGKTYQLQATSDFIHWDTILSMNCTNSLPVTFQITNEPGYDCRFFRLRTE